MIALTGGGTGGHLAVVDALKNALGLLDQRVIFVGSTKGQDKAWFASDQAFASRYFLDSSGVMNRGFVGKIAAIFALARLVFATIKIFKIEGVKAVVSVGGYSAAPATIAAIITRKKLYIHEQNGVLGALNRIARPFATQFFSSFCEESICKDYPVKREFFDKARIRSSVKTVIFLGGSQGASAINNFAMLLANDLAKNGIKIIHQTGKGDLAKLKQFYADQAIDATVFDFDKNISDQIAKADFAVCRSGAGTLFELAANALPALFVPYPYAAGNHQEANAKFLADQKLADYMNESDLNAQKALEIILADQSAKSERLMKLISPNGANCMAKVIAGI